jgi:hypothetical protein
MIGATSNFDHLRRLTASDGLFEHCLGGDPRPEHGYCTDDVARALVVVSREPDAHRNDDLSDAYVRYLSDALRVDGRFANRRTVTGRWADSGASDDASGRALWGLATAMTLLTDDHQRQLAAEAFNEACVFRSPWPRATAMAVAGASEVLRFDPTHRGALAIMIDAAQRPAFGSQDYHWPWPHDRLRYANALIPQTLLLIGEALGLTSYVDEGTRLLSWLIATETHPMGWLSFTPTGGWTRGEPRPGFDQQPIEAATLAEACVQASMVTGDPTWLSTVTACAAWFLGVNDAATPMIDQQCSAGYDGLTRHGRNDNRGAESTIAALLTMQHFRQLCSGLTGSTEPAADDLGGNFEVDVKANQSDYVPPSERCRVSSDSRVANTAASVRRSMPSFMSKLDT